MKERLIHVVNNDEGIDATRDSDATKMKVALFDENDKFLTIDLFRQIADWPEITAEEETADKQKAPGEKKAEKQVENSRFDYIEKARNALYELLMQCQKDASTNITAALENLNLGSVIPRFGTEEFRKALSQEWIATYDKLMHKLQNESTNVEEKLHKLNAVHDNTVLYLERAITENAKLFAYSNPTGRMTKADKIKTFINSHATLSNLVFFASSAMKNALAIESTKHTQPGDGNDGRQSESNLLSIKLKYTGTNKTLINNFLIKQPAPISQVATKALLDKPPQVASLLCMHAALIHLDTVVKKYCDKETDLGDILERCAEEFLDNMEEIGSTQTVPAVISHNDTIAFFTISKNQLEDLQQADSCKITKTPCDIADVQELAVSEITCNTDTLQDKEKGQEQHYITFTDSRQSKARKKLKVTLDPLYCVKMEGDFIYKLCIPPLSMCSSMLKSKIQAILSESKATVLWQKRDEFLKNAKNEERNVGLAAMGVLHNAIKFADDRMYSMSSRIPVNQYNHRQAAQLVKECIKNDSDNPEEQKAHLIILEQAVKAADIEGDYGQLNTLMREHYDKGMLKTNPTQPQTISATFVVLTDRVRVRINHSQQVTLTQAIKELKMPDVIRSLMFDGTPNLLSRQIILVRQFDVLCKLFQAALDQKKIDVQCAWVQEVRSYIEEWKKDGFISAENILEKNRKSHTMESWTCELLQRFDARVEASFADSKDTVSFLELIFPSPDSDYYLAPIGANVYHALIDDLITNLKNELRAPQSTIDGVTVGNQPALPHAEESMIVN